MDENIIQSRYHKNVLYRNENAKRWAENYRNLDDQKLAIHEISKRADSYAEDMGKEVKLLVFHPEDNPNSVNVPNNFEGIIIQFSKEDCKESGELQLN